MKKISILFVFVLSAAFSFGQNFADSAAVYFKELKVATKKASNLWDKDMYGSLMLLDFDNELIYANIPDSAGEFKQVGSVYVGKLKGNNMRANTTTRINGIQWATVILPLPENKYDAINLMAHELFHSVQPDLIKDMEKGNVENNHLNEKDGRVYLRLELEALKKALRASNKKDMHKHLTAAFVYRQYRRSLYSGTDATENQLELAEGTAEYTGEMTCGRGKQDRVNHLVNNIDQFVKNPTYVRSFAYNTLPAYGWLLWQSNNSWNKKITGNTPLTEMMMEEFKIKLPADLKKAVDAMSDDYRSEAIVEEETARELRINKQLSEYKDKFVTQPHFKIKLEKKSISFDPRNIVPMGDLGSVYPTAVVTDLWGKIEVTNGLLLSPDWKFLTVSLPQQIDGKVLTGDGWKLELANNYIVVIRDGIFSLQKKQ